jgi:hypothetical protein
MHNSNMTILRVFAAGLFRLAAGEVRAAPFAYVANE